MLQITEEQTDRNLLELADLMDQVQARHGHFDMQRWVKMTQGEQPNSCRTPSCAAGWWAHHRYGVSDWPQDNSARTMAQYFSNIIERDFGIGQDTREFARLFGAHPHRTAAAEARMLREFVELRQLARAER